MQRWNGLADVPTHPGGSVVTIGNFDGVHRGHQRVLTELVSLARARNARSVAITFDPHPIAVLFPERAPKQIDGLTTRLERMERTGLDAVMVMTFTRELAMWSPRRFVEEVLVGALDARAVVVGRDTRFGHRNSGDIDTLRELGAELGFEVFAVEDVGIPAEDDPQRRWSSTGVRSMLAEGDVRSAATVLGHLHRLRGIVVHGDHRGRELGYPTANLAQDAEGMIPADGVYAGWLTVLAQDGLSQDGLPQDGLSQHGTRLPAAISVGTNPTFDGSARRVEAYVLDRDDLELYGVMVAVDFLERLRATERFEDVETLVAQMHRDVEATRDVLAAARPVA